MNLGSENNERVFGKQFRAPSAVSENCNRYECSRCKQNVRPCADTLPNWKTHLIAGLLFIIGLPFCVFIPYCFDCCGANVSRCPKCGAYMNVNDPEDNGAQRGPR